MKNCILLICFAFATIAAVAQKKDEFVVNTKQSTVKWSGKKIVGRPTEGTINLTSGTLTVADKQLTGGSFTLDTKSISSATAQPRLVEHLKNSDFFDVEKFPTASFVITKVKPQQDQVLVTGNITIKGITKPLSFPAKISYSGAELLATATQVKVDRTQFGIQYNSGSIFSSLGDRAIEDDFVLDISIRATKK